MAQPDDSSIYDNVKARMEAFFHKTPQIHETAFVAKSAEIMGDVRLGPKTSVWPQCVLRGDINYIEIGEGSNVQDGTIVHLADEYPAVVGKYVTIGHKAMIHACAIEDECLIGMSATVLDGAVIGRRSIVGAGAVVPPGMQVPPGSMVLGVPGKVVKTLDEETQAGLRYWAEKYVACREFHRAAGT
jgi:carbonic anhydrase/acetyltransferase-like protein (isoleucine patch superfamily)